MNMPQEFQVILQARRRFWLREYPRFLRDDLRLPESIIDQLVENAVKRVNL